MSSASGYGNTVTCPFNATHNVRKEVFQTHLVKCSKSYPHIKLEKCPFNSTHLLPPNALDEHVINCEDRASLDLFKYTIDVGASRKENKQKVEPILVLPSDTGENWDNDDYPTYDPQAYVQSNKIIRTLNLAPPAERRAFRDSERLRLNNLNNMSKKN